MPIFLSLDHNSRYIFYKKIFLFLGLTVSATIFFNILFFLFYQSSPLIVRFLGFPYEANFPTWLSSMLLFLSGLIAFQCSAVIPLIPKEKEAFKALGFLLIVMSCDETAMIHEYVGPIINQLFFSFDFPKIQWVVIFFPPVIAAIMALGFLLAKPLRVCPRACFYLVLGTIIFCSGAFAIESSMEIFDYGFNAKLTRAEIFFEESLELIGEFLFLMGMGLYYQKAVFLRESAGAKGQASSSIMSSDAL